MVPIVVHGDDAESHRRRSFLVTTVGSILTEGSSWDTKLVCYCTDNARCKSECVKTLDQWLAWSLLEMQCGYFLDCDPYGQHFEPHDKGRRGPVAGPWRAVMVIHKGDEKYIQKAYQMTNSAVSQQVCFVCRAEQNGANVYTTYGHLAPHRSTLLSTQEFITTGCGQQAWTRLPGWSVSCLALDWLHAVDLTIVPECAASVACLTFFNCVMHDCQITMRPIAQIIFASGCQALVELTRSDLVWNGQNIDDRLRQAFVQFTALCRQHKVRFLLALSLPLNLKIVRWENH